MELILFPGADVELFGIFPGRSVDKTGIFLRFHGIKAFSAPHPTGKEAGRELGGQGMGMLIPTNPRNIPAHAEQIKLWEEGKGKTLGMMAFVFPRSLVFLGMLNTSLAWEWGRNSLVFFAPVAFPFPIKSSSQAMSFPTFPSLFPHPSRKWE